MENGRLKILTYNIHKGFSTTNARFVLHQIKQSLEEIHPDIVFLQEIMGSHSTHENRIGNWPKQPQFEFLADQLWPHFAYGKNAIYEKGHHGNAILSKFPFIAWENIDVSWHEKASRSLLHGVLHLPNSHVPLHTVCIHFGLFTKERKEQLQILCERIDSHVPHGEPLIIAGDFNDWQGRAEDFLETYLNMQEAFKVLTGKHAKTFPVWRPTLEVDRVYFRNLELKLGERFNKPHWRRLSDHAPLYAEFTIIPS